MVKINSFRGDLTDIWLKRKDWFELRMFVMTAKLCQGYKAASSFTGRKKFENGRSNSLAGCQTKNHASSAVLLF